MAHQMEEVQVSLVPPPSLSPAAGALFPSFTHPAGHKLIPRTSGCPSAAARPAPNPVSPPCPVALEVCATFSPFSLQNVEDQHLLMHDQTVIRKGQ